MYVSLKKIALSLCTITCFAPLYAGIENLHGTYAILPPQWRHLSVAHGAILVETHWIDNFYDFYAMAPIGHGTALGKLVTTLYYRNPAGGFGLTQTLQNPDNPVTLGHQLAELIFAVATNQKPPSTKFRNIEKKGFDLKPSTITNALHEIAQKEPATKAPETASSTLPLVTTAAEPVTASSTVPETASSTIDTAACSFSADTVLNILLAVVWDAGKDNRVILNAYYQKISELIAGTEKPKAPEGKRKAVAKAAAAKVIREKRGSSSATTSGSSETSTSSSSEPPVAAAAAAAELLPAPFLSTPEAIKSYVNEVATSFNPGTDITKLWEANPALFEELLYIIFSPGQYPNTVSYTTVYLTLPDGNTISFPDCMDTACRNFMNVLWYDKDNKNFNESMLLKYAPDAKPITPLREFYSHFTNPFMAGSGEAHNQWAQLIGNIPGIVYKTDGYEIRSELTNFIILMNHLLGLALFKEDIQNLFFLRNSPTFIKDYFPALCKKLNIIYEWQAENGQPINNDTIDAFEKEKPIITKLNFDRESDSYTHHLVTTFHSHGEFKSLSAVHISQSLRMILTNQKLVASNQTILAIALWLLGKNDQELPQLAISAATIAPLFYLPLSDPDFIVNFIEGQSLTSCISNIIIYPASKIPDPVQRIYTLAQIKKIQLSNNIAKLYEETVKKIITIANENIKSIDTPDRIYALTLFSALVNAGQTYPEAIAAAKENINSSDIDTRLNALNLFNALVTNGQAYSEAIAAVQENIKSTVLFIHAYALDLLIALVKKGQAYPEAIAAAKENINSSDIDTRLNALNLFNALVTNGRAYSEAIAAVQENINNKDDSIRYSAHSLLEMLVKNDHAYLEAAATAKENFNSPDRLNRNYALILFNDLFKKSRAYPEAIAAVQENLKSLDTSMRLDVLRLLIMLIENGHAYLEAIAAAQENIKSLKKGLNAKVWLDTLNLLKALVEKGKGYQEAIAAVRETIIGLNYEAKEYSQKYCATNLLNTLKKHFTEHPEELTKYLAAHPEDEIKLKELGIIK